MLECDVRNVSTAIFVHARMAVFVIGIILVLAGCHTGSGSGY
jgi:hypothetical protein